MNKRRTETCGAFEWKSLSKSRSESQHRDESLRFGHGSSSLVHAVSNVSEDEEISEVQSELHKSFHQLTSCW